MRAVLFGILLALGIGPGHAESGQCPDVRVNHEAPDPRHENLVCSAADTAIEHLANCGLEPSMPITVRVVEELPPECPTHALAFFDVATDAIMVPTLQACADLVGPRGRFGLPMSPALYRSILVHEFVHASLVQHDDDRALNRPEHEYIAYSIQFSLMPTEMRTKVLERYPHEPPARVAQLSESYHDLSPPDFAVKAYLHFTQPGNGCDFVHRLLTREAFLPANR